jgi:5-formyltetrahydrofolate cyclo-ligase
MRPEALNPTVALSLREQLVAEVPVTTHDWRVDALIVGDNRCLVRQED